MKVLFFLVTCIGFVSCGPIAEEPEPNMPIASRYVGQINSINPEKNFVLIRRSPGIALHPGMILISRGPGDRVANLRVSGESLGQMYAADIQSGMPEVGDSVMKAPFEEDDEVPAFLNSQP